MLSPPDPETDRERHQIRGERIEFKSSRMGRATRWLMSLFRGKRESRDRREIPSDDQLREKRRWSFRSGRESVDSASRFPPPKPPSDAAWLRSLESETSKHAIAVAAATAAAADAAVAAAHAAVAVVRLTSHGGAIERLAAIKIQTLFRAYLARRALRALKALVKLQALVRGYLIRKEAAAALQSVEALMRAQAAALGQKPELDWSPKIVEIDTGSRRPPLTPERRCSFTAQNTPRLPKSPNYMSKTRASEARARAHSAPRQRPETRGRIPLGELLIEQSRPSLAFPTAHRSCSDTFSFKSAVVGRLDRSLECARNYSAKGFYLEKKR